MLDAVIHRRGSLINSEATLLFCVGTAGVAAGALVGSGVIGWRGVSLTAGAVVTMAILLAPSRGAGVLALDTLQRLAVLTTTLALVLVTSNGLRARAGLAAADVPLSIAAISCAVVMLTRPDLRRPVPRWITLSVCGIAATALASSLWNGSAVLGSLGSAGRLVISLGAVPLVVAAASFGSFTRLSWYSAAFAAGALMNAAIGAADTAGVAHIQGHTDSVSFDRATALTTHPNHLGIVCAMAFPFVLASSLRHTSRRAAGLHLVAAGVLLSGLLASGSRAGVIGAVVGLLVAVAIYRPARRRIAVTIALLAGTTVAVGAAVGLTHSTHFLAVYRLLGGSTGVQKGSISAESISNSDAARLALYHQALNNIYERPFTGVGFAQVREYHDIYLQVAQAGGLLALLAFLTYIFGAIGTARRNLRLERMADGWLISMSAAGSFAAWLTAGLFQNAIYDRYIYVPVGLLLGVTWAAFRR
jgi:hypothetical protein